MLIDTDDVAAFLCARVSGLLALYLFGSAARPNGGPVGDIDIAFLGRRPIASTLRWQIQEDLALRIRRDVDLVDLRQASTVLGVQVLATGAIFYESSPPGRAEFEMILLAEYADLNLRRQQILADVAERGSIYG